LKLIVGLGNPGPQYRDTLHNVGFDVVDELVRRHQAQWSAWREALTARVHGWGDGVILMKPLTFMNLSGTAIGELQRFFKIALEDTLVVVDDVNLPEGQLRIRRGGSAGGHNGLKSIESELGTSAFPRLRIGVGRGDPRRNLAAHVLAKAAPDSREILKEATGRAADAAELFVTGTLAEVMNRFNAKPASENEAETASDTGSGGGKSDRTAGTS
jgi:peptidyl-tRNA hydrolase, PTH1 family